MKIAVDVDGVLANFIGGFCQVADSIWPGRIPPGREPTEWDLRGLGLSGEEVSVVLGEVEKTHNFWRTLEPYEDILRTRPLDRLSESRYELCFVTSRFPTRGDSVWEQTLAWLADHGLVTRGTAPVMVTDDSRKKAEVVRERGIYCLLDDYHETVSLVNDTSPCRAYLLDRPWNRDARGLQRVKSVGEFVNLVKDI